MAPVHAPTAVRALAPSVGAEVAREWAATWPRWFGPERVPLPRAAEKRHLALVETPLGPIVAKLESPTGWKRSLAALHARRLRAMHAFESARALLARDLQTPEPLAVLEARGPGACEAVFVSRYVEGIDAWEYLRLGGTQARLVERLAAALALLHATGFRHRDLKTSNLLLVAREREADSPAVLWTDLDGLRRLGTVPAVFRARDLARLSMSFQSTEARAAGVRADLWPSLVQRYLEQSLGRAPAREELGLYLARTDRWSERAIRRNLRSGRPVH